MPYTLIAENAAGERLQLTGNRNYDVLDVSGTSPPAANVNLTNIVGRDGAKENSSFVGTRNLVITLNIHHPIEANRIALYRYFRPKKQVRIYYQNKLRKVHIDGIVESFENNPWTQAQQPQISIICPQPYWLSDSETVATFSNSLALFKFPFAIPAGGIEFSRRVTQASAFINVGEIDTGGIIRFIAHADGVVNPQFFNRTTNEYFGVSIEMDYGDIVEVNTNKGFKSVKLIRDGIETSLLSSRLLGSSWITFYSGTNEIAYDASDGAENLECTLTVLQMFEGV